MPLRLLSLVARPRIERPAMRRQRCASMGAEMERVSRRASEVAGVQDSNKSQDVWVTGAAIVLFWPAAFFVKGDGATAQELARLKGEFEALERVAIEKNCNLQVKKTA